MPNSICLAGPPFSVSGDRYFPGTDIRFQLDFDNDADRNSVQSIEWYLNGQLVIDQHAVNFTASIGGGPYRISARILTTAGWSGVKGLVFDAGKVPVKTEIYGPEKLKEGESAAYTVITTFSDSSTADQTADYTFTASYGTFAGPVFHTDIDPAFSADRLLTITASKAGSASVITHVLLSKTFSSALQSLAIIGPDSLKEGEEGTYSVIATYVDHSTWDFTTEYKFSCAAGVFLGNQLKISTNDTIEGTRTDKVFASRNGVPQLSKQITITDQSKNPGILVVDLYSNEKLDVAAGIANATVYGGELAVYTGNNIEPKLIPSEALVLGSDYIMQPQLSWRFEFNIAKLVADYPDQPTFIFNINGRGLEVSDVSGSYRLLNANAVMNMGGSPGFFIPGINGGAALETDTFTATAAGGANGNHDLNSLSKIIQLTYDVALNKLTASTGSVEELDNFDFMTVEYHWIDGSGDDLDIMVGFEKTATSYDNQYVGFNQHDTIPDAVDPATGNTYLWWALDNTTGTGSEGVLIGMKKFVLNRPEATDIVEVGLYAVWYGTPLTGTFEVTLNTYLGGTMSVSDHKFVNTGGSVVYNQSKEMKTLVHNKYSDPAQAYKIGTVRYTKSTQKATVEFHNV